MGGGGEARKYRKQRIEKGEESGDEDERKVDKIRVIIWGRKQTKWEVKQKRKVNEVR